MDTSAKKWPTCPSFDELRALPQQNNSINMIEAEGRRYIYLPEADEPECFMYADAHQRSIYKLYSDSSNAALVAIDNWLHQESVRDANLLFLIWGGTKESSIKEGGLLTYPDVGHLIKRLDLKSVPSRRRLLDSEYRSDLYNPTLSQYTLAKRVYLGVFYDIVGSPFLTHPQKRSAAEKFLGALSYIHEIVLNGQGDDILSLFGSIKKVLIEQGLLSDHPLISVATSMGKKGKQLFQDLQCTYFSEKQRLLRLFADPLFALEYLAPKMSMNWPSEDLWWLEGFELSIDESGWCVFRKGHRLLAGYESKQRLMEALKTYICSRRVKPIKESEYFLSRNGVRYQVPEGEDLNRRLAAVDVFHLRPQKRRNDWPTSNNLVGEFKIQEYIDEMECDFEATISGALYSLSNVLGISALNLSLSGELGIHVTGRSEEPQIALWTKKAPANAMAGGIAYAWAELFYEELVQQHASSTSEEQIYFPDVNNDALKDLFNVILLKKVICKPSPDLFEFERKVIGDIEKETNLAISGGISQINDEDFSALCASLMSLGIDRKDELIRGVQQVRCQWTFLNGNSNIQVLNNYTRESRNRALERNDESLVKGKSLFSRAFEAYIHDCLQMLNKPNDLLVYGTTCEDRIGIRVYPDGVERFRMRLAFDTFFSEYPLAK